MWLIITIIMIIGGGLLIVFHKRLAQFNRETDEMILIRGGKRNPLPGESSLSILLSGIGFLLLGLLLLLKIIM